MCDAAELSRHRAGGAEYLYNYYSPEILTGPQGVGQEADL